MNLSWTECKKACLGNCNKAKAMRYLKNEYHSEDKARDCISKTISKVEMKKERMNKTFENIHKSSASMVLPIRK